MVNEVLMEDGIQEKKDNLFSMEKKLQVLSSGNQSVIWFHTRTKLKSYQRWAIGTWDRYSGIPVLPEVKISTDYLNTDLFKKILNTC